MERYELKGTHSYFVLCISYFVLCIVSSPVFAGEMVKKAGGVPVEFQYDHWEMTNFQQENEIHRLSGNPVSVTAVFRDAPVFLTTSYLTFNNYEGVISATSGVTITDGTFTVQAQEGTFDLKRKVAHFTGDVHLSRRAIKAGEPGVEIESSDVKEVDYWGSSDQLTVYMGEAGFERLESSGGGRMNIYFRGGAGELMPFGAGKSRRKGSPEASPIQREMSPLEQ